MKRWSGGVARNDSYFGESARAHAINYRVLPEEFTRIAEFEAGNLDIVEVPAAEFARFASDSFWQKRMKSRVGLNTYYLGFNCRKAPMDDPVFRRAINMAIDRQKIADVTLQGRARPAKGPIPPELPGHTTDGRRSLGEKAGRPIKLYQRARRSSLEISEAVQYYLRKAGLDVEIVQLEWTAFKQAVSDGHADMFLLSWHADYPDAENFLFPVFHSSNWGASGNRAFCSPCSTRPTGAHRETAPFTTTRRSTRSSSAPSASPIRVGACCSMKRPNR